MRRELNSVCNAQLILGVTLHAKQTFLFVLTMTTHIVTDLCYMCNHTQWIGVLILKWAVRLVISRLSATSKMGFKKKKSRWGNQKRQRFVIHLFYMKQGIYKISPWCFFFHFFSSFGLCVKLQGDILHKHHYRCGVESHRWSHRVQTLLENR